jgi:hypothetical protein
LHVERDRHALDRNDLAPELGHFGDGSALLAGKDRDKSITRGVGRTVVDVDRAADIAFQDVARDVHNHGDGPPGDIDPIHVAGIEMIGKGRIACAIVWVFADPARSEDAAIAYFQQASLQMIGHFPSPSLSCSSSEPRRCANAQAKEV